MLEEDEKSSSRHWGQKVISSSTKLLLPSTRQRRWDCLHQGAKTGTMQVCPGHLESQEKLSRLSKIPTGKEREKYSSRSLSPAPSFPPCLPLPEPSKKVSLNGGILEPKSLQRSQLNGGILEPKSLQTSNSCYKERNRTVWGLDLRSNCHRTSTLYLFSIAKKWIILFFHFPYVSKSSMPRWNRIQLSIRDLTSELFWNF